MTSTINLHVSNHPPRHPFYPLLLPSTATNTATTCIPTQPHQYSRLSIRPLIQTRRPWPLLPASSTSHDR